MPDTATEIVREYPKCLRSHWNSRYLFIVHSFFGFFSWSLVCSLVGRTKLGRPLVSFWFLWALKAFESPWEALTFLLFDHNSAPSSLFGTRIRRIVSYQPPGPFKTLQDLLKLRKTNMLETEIFKSNDAHSEVVVTFLIVIFWIFYQTRHHEVGFRRNLQEIHPTVLPDLPTPLREKSGPRRSAEGPVVV